jgi:hypothetical protein
MELFIPFRTAPTPTNPDQLAADIRRFFRPLRPATSKEN